MMFRKIEKSKLIKKPPTNAKMKNVLKNFEMNFEK